MKFDRLEHSLKFVSNSGSPWKKVFRGEVREDGEIELVFDHEENFYKRIQADAVGSDLPSIIARATAGDPTAFRDSAGFYGDIVGMPSTYAEILNTVNAGKDQFEHLPLEVREKFDFSFEKWFATAGTEEWFSKHGFGTSPAQDPEFVSQHNQDRSTSVKEGDNV